MKTVAIVGAGPAGLVAAKTLLRHPSNELKTRSNDFSDAFKVTVFESADRVGGMWRAREDEHGDKCSPSMPTNLSRFTVSFSDLSWNNVNLGSDKSHSNTKPPAPMFPRAHEVGKYLEAYAKKFISDEAILLNRRVESAEFTSDKWHITSYDTANEERGTDTFDYLIVASGFFHRAENSLRQTSPQIPRQHSTKFRDVSSLTKNPGNILIVGGGISGSEAAATAALQISNAKFAPGAKPSWASSKVYHVFDRPFYCLPRYLPQNPYDASIQDYRLAPDFLPLDLVLYNLSRRKPKSGEQYITATNGPVPSEKARKGHEFMRTEIGSDQRELGHDALVYKPDQTDYPGYTGISDTYAEFVRSGVIVPVTGRAETVSDTEGRVQVHISHTGRWSQRFPPSNTTKQIDNVVGIIEATGFQPDVEFLSDEIKSALNYDPSCRRIPFLLSKGSIFAPSVPSIAFVGFYEGPYWGVMEMQVRAIANKWAPSTELQGPAQPPPTSTEETERTRKAIKESDLSVPQFWMADYIGMMEEFRLYSNTLRRDQSFSADASGLVPEGPVFPARYVESNVPHEGDIRDVEEELQNLLRPKSTRFVAAAAFRGMQGRWTLRRKIDSSHPTSPGGTFTGEAHFHPRFPTAPGIDGEYLYIETGTFTMDNGYAFPASRKYVYRYSERHDQISTFFVGDDGESADRLFNQLVFEYPDQGKGEAAVPGGKSERGWVAKSDHWCDPDTYRSECEFRFRGATLERLGVTYSVSGPQKDYTHESWYERPTPATVA